MKENKKVLVVAPLSPDTGSHESKLYDMISDEFDVKWISPASDLAKTQMSNVNILSKNYFLFAFQIRKIIKQWKPDLIHFHYIDHYKSIANFFRPVSTPMIATVWGSDIMKGPYESRLWKMSVANVLNTASAITCDASHSIYEINKIISGKKIIKKIFFGIQDSESLSRDNCKENIIYSSRGHLSRYNIDKIIVSFYEFQKKFPDWHLYISGVEDPVNTPLYKEMVNSFGIINKVKFLGFINSVENRNFMKKSKIFVSIPENDAVSVSLMEAICANCICFVSDLPANYELIVNGVNGIIVNDSSCAFQRFQEIDEHLMQKVNKKLREQLTFEESKEQLLTLYNQILLSQK